MAQNVRKSGDTLTLTAPAGGVVGGTAYKIGQLLVVAAADAAAGAPFEGITVGDVTLPATAADAWTPGAVLYWDNVAGALTDVFAAGMHRCGVATGTKLAAETTATVKLNGFASPDGA